MAMTAMMTTKADAMLPRLRHWLSLLLTLPVTLVAVVFAVVNRQSVPVDLWPFGLTVELPLFLLSLGTLGLGMVIGAGLLWLPLMTARRRTRKQEKKLSQVTAELRLAESRIKSAGQPARDAIAAPANAPTPALPARSA